MIPVISIFEMKTASSRDELATRDGCGGGAGGQNTLLLAHHLS